MDIRQSVQELLSREETVTRRFYDVLLRRHPELRPYFQRVNLRQQAVILTTALSMIELQYTGSLSGPRKYLRVLGERHAALGIPREAFAPFRECLLETLADCHGGHWSQDLHSQWHEAMDEAIALMFAGYDHFEQDGSDSNG